MKKIANIATMLMALMVIFFTGAMAKAEPVQVDKTQLQVAVDEATAILNEEDPETPYYPELLQAKNNAQAVLDNAEATKEQVAEQTSLLTEAIATYKAQNPVIEVKEEAREEAIPFKTETIEDNTLMAGEEVIDQEGEEGTLTITEKVTYENGVETAREEISREVTKEPVKRIVRVGTMVVEVKTETKEQTIAFETITVEDNTLMAGTQVVDTEGQAGTVKITEEVTFTNGVETARKEISREVLTAKVDRVIRVGTYQVNFSALNDIISYAEKIDLSMYSLASAENLRTALSNAYTIKGTHLVAQSEIDSAAVTLKYAINSLKSYATAYFAQADISKVSPKSSVNISAKFTNAGTETITNLLVTDSIGLSRSLGQILPGESKVFTLTYTMPSDFKGAESYSISSTATAMYADGTYTVKESTQTFIVTSLSSEELDKERDQQLAQNFEEAEVANKHQIELPTTGEGGQYAYYAVILLTFAAMAFIERMRKVQQ